MINWLDIDAEMHKIIEMKDSALIHDLYICFTSKILDAYDLINEKK